MRLRTVNVFAYDICRSNLIRSRQTPVAQGDRGFGRWCYSFTNVTVSATLAREVR
jgi:hypothetical protein